MPDSAALSLTGANVEAAAAKTRMAASIASLFQAGFNPTPNSLKIDFEAEEADYDGYAPVTIATWSDPILAGDGWMTFAPTQNIPWVFDADAVGNAIGGYWLETAGGVVIGYGVFDPARAVTGPGMSVIFTPVLQYNSG